MPALASNMIEMDLSKKVALVTGASRGVGRGIAIGLGEAGCTVYMTGRTMEEGEASIPLPGTLRAAAADVDKAGGKGIPVRCDHLDDAEVEALFGQIDKLDILVNNTWGGYEHFYDGTEFWNEKGFWTAPLSRWDKMMEVGVRSHYVASVFAANKMVAQKSGLIVNVSSFAALRDTEGVLYSMAKAADVKMAGCMAHDLREHNVAALSILPGLVRTEAVLKAGEYFDLSNSESPEFIGRAIAALAADPELMSKSGGWFVAAELAEEYGFTDIDGKQPRSLREELLS